MAIEAAPAAIPVKPKIPAIIAIIKKIAAHLSITLSLKVSNNILCVNFHAIIVSAYFLPQPHLSIRLNGVKNVLVFGYRRILASCRRVI